MAHLQQAADLFRKKYPGLVSDTLKTSIEHGVKQNPDASAKTQASARGLNIPIDFAERQSEEVNKISIEREIYKRLQETKILKKMMENPDFSAIAHDDVKTLAAFEEKVEGVTSDIRALRGPVPTAGSYLKGLGVGTVSGAEKIRQGIRLQWAELINSERMKEDALRKLELAETETQRFDPEFESSTARGIYGGLTSLTRQGPALIASIYARQPSLVLGYMGQSVQAEAYGKYISRGATPREAFFWWDA